MKLFASPDLGAQKKGTEIRIRLLSEALAHSMEKPVRHSALQSCKILSLTLRSHH
jgi:hypothetical protein